LAGDERREQRGTSAQILGNKGTEGTAGVEPFGCVLEDNCGCGLNYFCLEMY